MPQTTTTVMRQQQEEDEAEEVDEGFILLPREDDRTTTPPLPHDNGGHGLELLDLNEECLLQVLSHLPSERDLVRVSLVCSMLARLAEDPSLWKVLFQRRWPLLFSRNAPSFSSFSSLHPQSQEEGEEREEEEDNGGQEADDKPQQPQQRKAAEGKEDHKTDWKARYKRCASRYLRGRVFNRNPVMGIKELVQEGYLDTPQAVAQYLYSNERLDKSKVGLYLGYHFPSISHIDSMHSGGNHWTREDELRVLPEYVKIFDKELRTNDCIDVALRHFLSKFMLTGEAQQISRILETFSARWFAVNPSHPCADVDAAYILCYAVVLLNVDLHNDLVQQKMRFREFVRALSGSNAGQDFPLAYLAGIYKRILEHQFKLGQSELGPMDKEGWLYWKQDGWLSSWVWPWYRVWCSFELQQDDHTSSTSSSSSLSLETARRNDEQQFSSSLRSHLSKKTKRKVDLVMHFDKNKSEFCARISSIQDYRSFITEEKEHQYINNTTNNHSNTTENNGIHDSGKVRSYHSFLLVKESEEEEDDEDEETKRINATGCVMPSISLLSSSSPSSSSPDSNVSQKKVTTSHVFCAESEELREVWMGVFDAIRREKEEAKRRVTTAKEKKKEETEEEKRQKWVEYYEAYSLPSSSSSSSALLRRPSVFSLGEASTEQQKAEDQATQEKEDQH
ncbi:GDP/GTP exchange factor for ARF [Balamuthia mandrillaris]